MAHKSSVVTAGRFAQGMTFDEYVQYVGTPENLAREAGWWRGPQRRDAGPGVGALHGRVGGAAAVAVLSPVGMRRDR
jgi:hypothetical protein